MDYKDLTDEQRARIAACDSPDELLALAKAEGYELSDEDLEMVSGGWNDTLTCPQCGSKSISYDSFLSMHICQSCGHEF